MTSKYMQVVNSQPVLLNNDDILHEAILSLPKFKHRGFCHDYICTYLQETCWEEKKASRLYLTRSRIFFKKGSDASYCTDFSIGISNIEQIKSIDKELYCKTCLRTEVRVYNQLIILLKDGSPDKIYARGVCSLCFPGVVRYEVNSFYFECSNGEEFVRAVKEQMRSY